jgi:hypothetical protein
MRFLSGAFGASDDGLVVVGLGWDGCHTRTHSDGSKPPGWSILAALNGSSTRANNVSGDGKVVVGWQEETTGFRQGAKWIGRREELIRGPNGMVGEAFDANRDGSLIVGQDCGCRCWRRERMDVDSGAWRRLFSREPAGHATEPAAQAAMLATSEDGSTIGVHSHSASTANRSSGSTVASTSSRITSAVTGARTRSAAG